jgi:hypothetical protein
VLTCYRPISLLPIVSNITEKHLLQRFLKMVENNGFIPNHVFGFRERHSIIEKTHRIVQRMHKALETSNNIPQNS